VPSHPLTPVVIQIQQTGVVAFPALLLTNPFQSQQFFGPRLGKFVGIGIGVTERFVSISGNFTLGDDPFPKQNSLVILPVNLRQQLVEKVIGLFQ